MCVCCCCYFAEQSRASNASRDHRSIYRRQRVLHCDQAGLQGRKGCDALLIMTTWQLIEPTTCLRGAGSYCCSAGALYIDEKRDGNETQVSLHHVYKCIVVRVCIFPPAWLLGRGRAEPAVAQVLRGLNRGGRQPRSLCASRFRRWLCARMAWHCCPSWPCRQLRAARHRARR